jgi:hypothetical protein
VIPVPGLARLPAVRAVGDPSVNVVDHPKLIPVVIAAVIAVIGVWIGLSLFRWRRIAWREHLDAPVSLVPKRAGGTATAWKVFARHQEVADPSLVLLPPPSWPGPTARRRAGIPPWPATRWP